ncbi:MAG: hypothetical protein K6A65_08590 [Succinivibrionaceae bacterium]|nr:hypothetical protein [Succinivibrionaceae bacterium]
MTGKNGDHEFDVYTYNPFEKFGMSHEEWLFSWERTLAFDMLGDQERVAKVSLKDISGLEPDPMDDLRGLCASLSDLGQVRPVTLCALEFEPNVTPRYGAIDGLRRCLAARQLGWGWVWATFVELHDLAARLKVPKHATFLALRLASRIKGAAPDGLVQLLGGARELTAAGGSLDLVERLMGGPDHRLLILRALLENRPGAEDLPGDLMSLCLATAAPRPKQP